MISMKEEKKEERCEEMEERSLAYLGFFSYGVLFRAVFSFSLRFWGIYWQGGLVKICAGRPGFFIESAQPFFFSSFRFDRFRMDWVLHISFLFFPSMNTFLEGWG